MCSTCGRRPSWPRATTRTAASVSACGTSRIDIGASGLVTGVSCRCPSANMVCAASARSLYTCSMFAMRCTYAPLLVMACASFVGPMPSLTPRFTCSAVTCTGLVSAGRNGARCILAPCTYATVCPNTLSRVPVEKPGIGVFVFAPSAPSAS